MQVLQYDNFDILIQRSSDAFEAKVVNSPSGETPSLPFAPPVSEEKLELLVLKLRTAHGVRALDTDTTPDTKQFGSALFDSLFHDDLLDRLRRSLSRAEVGGRGLRIRLRFSDAHELWNIPWEFLYDNESHRFLCQFDNTPVVRYVDIAQPVQPLTVQGPIQMLAMISSPSDHPPLNIEQEWQHLSQALAPLEATGSLTVTRLSTASLEELRHATMVDDFHVFHYIGHGGLDRQTGEGLLVLTGSDGRSQLATGPELFVMLANSPIRLAVLNSCLGARISAVDPFAGTAASLVHQGIPAVVAMQFEISDYAAIAFSRTFYEAIAYGWPVDMALGEARRAILATSKSEWATPVLYLRAAEGTLLDVTAPPRTPAPAQPTGLVGTVASGAATLRWAAIPAGLTAVGRWEVRRDGVVIREVTDPLASDEPPGPGSYQYTVVAVGADGQRSAESLAWTARILGGTQRPRWLIGAMAILLAAIAATAVLLLALRQQDDTVPRLTPAGPLPATPAGLEGTVSGTEVNLEWDSDPADSAVVKWEVRRDGVTVTEVTEPLAVDDVPVPGFYSYTLVAVGADGQRSAESESWYTPPAWVKLDAGFQRAFTAAGVAVHKGELWVVGGSESAGDNSRERDDVRVFNPETGMWHDGPRLETVVKHAKLVSTGEELFLLGGLTGDAPVASVYRLDPDDPNAQWVLDEPLPKPRFAGAAAWDGHRLVFAGGAQQLGPRSASADIWALQAAGWAQIDDLQHAREHLAAVTDDEAGTVWFVGGADVERGLVFGDVDVLTDDTAGASEAIGTAIQGTAAIWTSETGICVFGGATEPPKAADLAVNEVRCLGGSEPDPDWPDLPEPRTGASAAVIDDTVYVVGGYRSPTPLEATDMVLALRFR